MTHKNIIGIYDPDCFQVLPTLTVFRYLCDPENGCNVVHKGVILSWGFWGVQLNIS